MQPAILIHTPDTINNFIKKLQKILPKKNVKTLEKESHVTLLAVINDPTFEEKFTREIQKISSIDLRTDGYGWFHNDGEDVLFIKIKSTKLEKLHKSLKRKINNDHHSGKFQPHITVAYFKSNSEFDPEIKCIDYKWTSNELVFSYAKNNQLKVKLSKKRKPGRYMTLKELERYNKRKLKRRSATYPGNMGISEMMQFYMHAPDEKIQQMDVAVNNNDEQAVMMLLNDTLGTELHSLTEYAEQPLHKILNRKKKKKKNYTNVAKPDKLKSIMKEVSLGKDDNGYFVYTHRARSDSYKTPEAIPKSKIEFISSTGSKKVAVIKVIKNDKGYLQYDVEDGVFFLVIVETYPEYRNQGVATDLLNQFLQIVDDAKGYLDMSGFLPLGEQYLRSTINKLKSKYVNIVWASKKLKRKSNNTEDGVVAEGEWAQFVIEPDTGYEYLKSDPGVALLLYRTDNKEKPFLCVFEETPAHEDIKPILSSLTGTIDGDDTPEETAVREAKEEAGITITEDDLEPLGEINPAKNTNWNLTRFAVNITDIEIGKRTTDGTEIEEKAFTRWVSESDIADSDDSVLHSLLLNFKEARKTTSIKKLSRITKADLESKIQWLLQNNPKNAENSYEYAKDIIKGRFPEAEKVIATNEEFSYKYAKEVLHDPNPQTWGKRFLQKTTSTLKRRNKLKFRASIIKNNVNVTDLQKLYENEYLYQTMKRRNDRNDSENMKFLKIKAELPNLFLRVRDQLLEMLSETLRYAYNDPRPEGGEARPYKDAHVKLIADLQKALHYLKSIQAVQNEEFWSNYFIAIDNAVNVMHVDYPLVAHMIWQATEADEENEKEIEEEWNVFLTFLQSQGKEVVQWANQDIYGSKRLFKIAATADSEEFTLYLDVDGTIAEYDGNFEKGKFGDAITEMINSVNAFKKKHKNVKVVIYTARSKDEIDELKEFLDSTGLHYDEIQTDKPFFDVLVDDRVIQYNGDNITTEQQLNDFYDENLPFWKASAGYEIGQTTSYDTDTQTGIGLSQNPQTKRLKRIKTKDINVEEQDNGAPVTTYRVF